jgi:hypothetical protein
MSLEAFSDMQKALAYNLGSDPKVHDLSRVLRVPGFYHNKEKPFLSRIISYNGMRYKYKNLIEEFPPEPVKKFCGSRYQTRYTTSDSKFNGKYGSTNGNRNNELARIIGGMIKKRKDWSYIESEVWKHNSASIPPLSDIEVNGILRSLKRY